MTSNASLSVSDEFCHGTIDGFVSAPTSVAISSDGGTVVASSDLGELRVWDLHTRAVDPVVYVRRFNFSKSRYGFEPMSVRCCVALSPDGRSVALCEMPSTVPVLWNRAEKQPRMLTSLASANRGEFFIAIAISPDDGKYVVACKSEGVYMLDGKTGQYICEVDEIGSGKVLCVAFSPDGKLLVTGREGDPARVFDCDARRERFALVASRAVAFSPDGRTLATADNSGGSVRIAIVADGGTVRHVLKGHTKIVHSLVFAPDGATLATGSDDGTARLWDVQTGLCRTTIVHSKGAKVFSLAFCAFGRALATGSYVHEGEPACVWDIETGKCIASFEEPPIFALSSERTALVFASPDGCLLAVAHAQSVRLWDAVAIWGTKTAAGRTLTTTAKGVDVVETVVHVARQKRMTGREEGVRATASVSQ